RCWRRGIRCCGTRWPPSPGLPLWGSAPTARTCSAPRTPRTKRFGTRRPCTISSTPRRCSRRPSPSVPTFSEGSSLLESCSSLERATPWLILKVGSFLHRHHWGALRLLLLGPASSSD
ncbi:hypothetical protein ZEAMMB73_Zm00001d034042, partial [Zea mays]